MNEDMYRENILEHYKKPHNRGKIAPPCSQGHAINAFCGDDITFCLKVGGKKGSEKVAEVKFDGVACAICTASASMLTEEVEGKALDAARAIGKERVLELLGISPGPMRLKCALLPLKAFKLALYSHLGKKMDENELSDEDEHGSASKEGGK